MAAVTLCSDFVAQGHKEGVVVGFCSLTLLEMVLEGRKDEEKAAGTVAILPFKLGASFNSQWGF